MVTGKVTAATGIPESPIKPRRRKKRNLRWKSLIEAFEAGDYLVVPLTCSDDLREEGQLMSHCVGRNYPRSCHDGAVRIFSIRDLDGRRLATISLYFDFDQMRWRLEQCKGIENREICFTETEPTDLHFLAHDIVRLYQQEQRQVGDWRP